VRRYVLDRVGQRFVDILDIVGRLDKNSVVHAPCDGAGVVGLACLYRGIVCHSSDLMPSHYAKGWCTVKTMDCADALKFVQRNEIVILSHCLEFVPKAVEQALAMTDRVIVHGKERVFSGCSKLTKLNTDTWVTLPLSNMMNGLSKRDRTVASTVYSNKAFRCSCIGLLSDEPLPVFVYMFRMGISSKFIVHPAVSSRAAVAEYLLSLGHSVGDGVPEVVVCCNNNDHVFLDRVPWGELRMDLRSGMVSPELTFTEWEITSSTQVRRHALYWFRGRMMRGSRYSRNRIHSEPVYGSTYFWFSEAGDHAADVFYQGSFASIMFVVM